MYRCAADLEAFQTTLIDQPACRKLDRTVGLRIAWHIGMLLQQGGGFFRADDGIFKETADITKHVRIRQFTVADCTHCIGNIFRRRRPARAQFGNGGCQIAITQIRLETLFQGEYDRNNHITPFAFLLEQAFSVGEAAIGIGKLDKGFRIQIEAAHAVNHVFSLHTVCTDVLHGRRADRTRNQAQVFQTAQTQRDGVQDKIVPDFARLRLDVNKAV